MSKFVDVTCRFWMHSWNKGCILYHSKYVDQTNRSVWARIPQYQLRVQNQKHPYFINDFETRSANEGNEIGEDNNMNHKE